MSTTADRKLVCVVSGRWESGPWTVLRTASKMWTLLYRSHDGARGEYEIDSCRTFREAVVLYETERGNREQTEG